MAVVKGTKYLHSNTNTNLSPLPPQSVVGGQWERKTGAKTSMVWGQWERRSGINSFPSLPHLKGHNREERAGGKIFLLTGLKDSSSRGVVVGVFSKRLLRNNINTNNRSHSTLSPLLLLLP